MDAAIIAAIFTGVASVLASLGAIVYSTPRKKQLEDLQGRVAQLEQDKKDLQAERDVERERVKKERTDDDNRAQQEHARLAKQVADERAYSSKLETELQQARDELRAARRELNDAMMKLDACIDRLRSDT